MAIIHEIWEACAALCGYALMAAGTGLFAWQVFSFLYQGDWPAVSLVEAGGWTLGWVWFQQPGEWLGVHWVLSQIPASLSAFVSGVALAVASETD